MQIADSMRNSAEWGGEGSSMDSRKQRVKKSSVKRLKMSTVYLVKKKAY